MVQTRSNITYVQNPLDKRKSVVIQKCAGRRTSLGKHAQSQRQLEVTALPFRYQQPDTAPHD